MQKALLGAKDLSRRALCVLLSLVLAAGLVPVAEADSAWAAQEEGAAAQEESCDLEGQSYVEDEVIIVYEDEALELDEELDLEGTKLAGGDGETSLEELGVVEQEEVASELGDEGACVVAELDDEGASVEELVEELACDPDIAYVQPNYLYEPLTTTTNDPYSGSDSNLSVYQYYLEASGFTEAWDEVRAEGSVTVAVIDTGCNLQHEDLQGTVDVEHAYDIDSRRALRLAHVDNNGDSYGHGTLVCGVISAYANNATGIAGASYNATVLPVRIYNDQNVAESVDAITAYTYLEYLIDTGEVDDLCAINMSLGYYPDDSTAADDRALEEAIATMREDYGVLTVCAGGNGDESETALTNAIYPADFDECISVTSVDEDGANSSFSDYNKYKDISAYGEHILSTSSSGGYASATGTSLAAPQVAAAIALLYTADPTLSPDEVVEVLESTADEVTGNLHAASGSAGILDVEEAVDVVLGIEEEDADADADAGDDASGEDAGGEDASGEDASGEDADDASSDDADADDETADDADDDAAADDEDADAGDSAADSDSAGSSAEEEDSDEPISFLDVQKPSLWYYEAVYALADAGYVTGYPNGCFGVGDDMDRAEFVTLLWRIACPDEYEDYEASSAVNETDMTDVADGQYYTQAVNWATENGVVTGFGSGRFKPHQSISFEQMCLIIARYSAGAQEISSLSSSVVESALEGFGDASKVSSWARAGMAWCVRAGLVEGSTSKRLDPLSDVARERVAVVVYRALDLGVL